MRRKLFVVGIMILLIFGSIGMTLASANGLSEVQIDAIDKGDVNQITDKEFAVDDNFVFVANLGFETGDAGGLIFGAKENSRSLVFNVDRVANLTKLIEFTMVEGIQTANVLKEEYIIGNDKATVTEINLIKNKMKDKSSFELKISYKADDGKFRFYLDGIERFRSDWGETFNGLVIEDYNGGKIGYNAFNSKINFNNIRVASDDYSYYQEIYRPQYHFTQPKSWNNDPNGMVYYNGYYHLFYQHNPYGKTWGDMYWAHARSKDLLTWEHMPIALFPDERGFMWSGSAIVDSNNVSGYFDSKGGLVAYLTREAGRQEQIMITSDDEGLTWTKRKTIITTEQNPFYTVDFQNIAFRDPKVFNISDSLYGIIIGGGRFMFYTSTNLVDWKHSSTLPIDAECPDAMKISTPDGDKWVLQLSSREYVVGTLVYEDDKVKFYNEDSVQLTAPNATLEDCNIKKMEYATDSYACQTFYINPNDAVRSKYEGKVVGLSWFSNPLAVCNNAGQMAELRDPWNGGFTFPVEFGLTKVQNEYVLTQTPINIDSLYAQTLIDINGREVTKEDSNILADINSTTYEISAVIDMMDAQKFGFRLNLGMGEYTEVGYDENGYYLDRTLSGNGGQYIPRYHQKYSSNVMAQDNLTFKILVDKNSVEVFAENYTTAFYAVTFASPSASAIELFCDNNIIVQSLTIKEIESVVKNTSSSDDCALYLSSKNLEMDLNLVSETILALQHTCNEMPTWSVTDSSVISIDVANNGLSANVKALNSGEAKVIVSCGSATVETSVSVGTKSFHSNIQFESSGITAGKWRMTQNGLEGKASGDGYLFADEVLSDFNYSAVVGINGGAAALIMRADKELNTYYMSNYDLNEKIVKLWSHNGILDTVKVENINVENFKLSAKLVGNNIKIYLNSTLVIDYTDANIDAPTEGYYGVNCFNNTATFKSLYTYTENFEITPDLSEVVIQSDSTQKINALYNVTKQNIKLDSDLYRLEGANIIIDGGYVATLSEGDYVFRASTDLGSFAFNLKVGKFTPLAITDEIVVGHNFMIYTGSTKVNEVVLNGKLLTLDDYRVSIGSITILGKNFNVGDNTVQVKTDEESFTFALKVKVAQTITENEEEENSLWWLAIVIPLCVIVVGGGGFCLYWFVLRKKFFNKTNNSPNLDLQKEDNLQVGSEELEIKTANEDSEELLTQENDTVGAMENQIVEDVKIKNTSDQDKKAKNKAKSKKQN